MSMNDYDLQSAYNSAVSEARSNGANDVENWRDLSENNKSVLTFFADAVERACEGDDPRVDPRPWENCGFYDIQPGFLVRGDKRSEFIVDHMRNGMWVNEDETKSVHVNTRGLQMVEFYEETDEDEDDYYDEDDDEWGNDLDDDKQVPYNEDDHTLKGRDSYNWNGEDRPKYNSHYMDTDSSKDRESSDGTREYTIHDDDRKVKGQDSHRDDEHNDSRYDSKSADNGNTRDRRDDDLNARIRNNNDLLDKIMEGTEKSANEVIDMISGFFDGIERTKGSKDPVQAYIEEKMKKRQERINRLKEKGYYQDKRDFPFNF